MPKISDQSLSNYNEEIVDIKLKYHSVLKKCKTTTLFFLILSLDRPNFGTFTLDAHSYTAL